MNAVEEYLDYNITKYYHGYQNMTNISTSINICQSIIHSVVLIICCIGLPLNGIVIWLLGFQIKRNPFTVLILNLAIADFGFLIFMTIFCIDFLVPFIQAEIHWLILFCPLNVAYINGLFLLAAVSIDRCVAVLFPIWHHCSRPKYLSPAICVFLWIYSFFLGGILNIVGYLCLYNALNNIHLLVTTVICLPLITTSTMILFIKICLKPKQIKRGRLLVMILITLLCFLILTLPLHIYVFTTHFLKNNLFEVNELDYYLSPTASLNSSINPVIYFLVGRKKRTRTRESIKVIFQRVFRDDGAPEI